MPKKCNLNKRKTKIWRIIVRKFDVEVLVDYRESIKNGFHLEDLVPESYRRRGNLFCNWGTPGYSRRVGINAYTLCV